MTLTRADLRRMRIVRSQVDDATACLYSSGRIIVVADGGNFGAARDALDALEAEAKAAEKGDP